jgi:glutathione peroxidase
MSSITVSQGKVEGVIQAGDLQRKKSGLLTKLTGGTTTVYVVANDKAKTVSVFEKEASSTALATVDISNDANVEFDDSIPFGIKLSNACTEEVFGAESKPKQEEWLNSFINAGAIYREAFNVDMENVKSFYELKDFDMTGNKVSMSKYKGKVVMVVNVSSMCKLTPTNYPQLTALDKKYRDKGLQILAFPCNQFASQEPGTHEEIMAFVKQYGCEFPFFEKHDVNGKDARPVFTYLKAKLPGSFGNFIKWNFTKFLIDRNGHPFKRYAPTDLPFTFEDDIEVLLAQKPNQS